MTRIERKTKKFIERHFGVKLRRHRGYWSIWERKAKLFELQGPRKWYLKTDRLFCDLKDVVDLLDYDGVIKNFVANLNLLLTVL